jgi:phosphatidate phosphatase APP1
MVTCLKPDWSIKSLAFNNILSTIVAVEAAKLRKLYKFAKFPSMKFVLILDKWSK